MIIYYKTNLGIIWSRYSNTVFLCSLSIYVYLYSCLSASGSQPNTKKQIGTDGHTRLQQDIQIDTKKQKSNEFKQSSVLPISRRNLSVDMFRARKHIKESKLSTLSSYAPQLHTRNARAHFFNSMGQTSLKKNKLSHSAAFRQTVSEARDCIGTLPVRTNGLGRIMKLRKKREFAML